MWYPSKYMANKYNCSDGSKVTQAQIDNLRSASYKVRYGDNPAIWCEGCGQRCQCSAHIIPQARCKQIGKTELIWSEQNYFPSCFKCNTAIENPKGQAWKRLKNIDKCLKFIYENDRQLWFKFTMEAINEVL